MSWAYQPLSSSSAQLESGAGNSSIDLSADAASFTYAAQNVSIKIAFKSGPSLSALTINEQPAGLRLHRKKSLQSSTFSFTGQTSNFGNAQKIDTQGSAHTVHGQNISLQKSLSLKASSTVCTTSGQTASITPPSYRLGASSADFMTGSGTIGTLHFRRRSLSPAAFSFHGHATTLQLAGQNGNSEPQKQLSICISL